VIIIDKDLAWMQEDNGSIPNYHGCN